MVIIIYNEDDHPQALFSKYLHSHVNFINYYVMLKIGWKEEGDGRSIFKMLALQNQIPPLVEQKEWPEHGQYLHVQQRYNLKTQPI